MHWSHGSAAGIVTIFLIFGCCPLCKSVTQKQWVQEGQQQLLPHSSSGIEGNAVDRRLMAVRTLHEFTVLLQRGNVHLHQRKNFGHPPVQHAPAYQPITFNPPPFAPNSPYAAGSPEVNVPGHPRIRIRSVGYPFNVIGLMENGCTGTLVGPCHVLTAGHCIYSHDRREYNTKMGFAPGQNTGTGSRVIKWKDFRVSEKWLWKEDFNADYAIVSLKEKAGSTLGWMGFGYNRKEEIAGLNMVGYPVDKPYGSMWYDYCRNVRFDYDAVNSIHHSCEVAEGNSGSPMWVLSRSTSFRQIRAIHNGARITARGGVPYASVVTPAVTADLKSMINQLQC